MRFLVARKFSEQPSLTLLCAALKWRELRQPSTLHLNPGLDVLSKESETGKMYMSGFDKWAALW
jgi:hypothetical protein